MNPGFGGQGFNQQAGNPRGRGRGGPYRGHAPRRGSRAKQGTSKLCKNFQKGTCNNPSCGFLHQFTYDNSLVCITRINANDSVFASALINETQIAVAQRGGIINVFDLSNGQTVGNFKLGANINAMKFTPPYNSEKFPHGVSFLFCGGFLKNKAPYLGCINCLTNETQVLQGGHQSGSVNAVEISSTGLIFSASGDGVVCVWFFNGSEMQFGMTLDVDRNLSKEILSLCILNDTILAGNSSGFILGWKYDYTQNVSQFQGVLEPQMNAKVKSIISFQDRFILCAADNGTIYCWDSQKEFAGWQFANVSEKTQVHPESITVTVNRQNETILLVASLSGDVMVYSAAQEVKFRFKISLHGAQVNNIVPYSNTQAGFLGFITTSKDGQIVLMNWTG